MFKYLNFSFTRVLVENRISQLFSSVKMFNGYGKQQKKKINLISKILIINKVLFMVHKSIKAHNLSTLAEKKKFIQLAKTLMKFRTLSQFLLQNQDE